MEALDGLRLLVDLRPQDLGRRADRLLEQGQQELLLAAEVLVEAAQRLAGALDNLLDRELLARRALGHQLEGGIEEPLHAALGASARRVERARDGLFTPRRGRLVARSPLRHRVKRTP